MSARLKAIALPLAALLVVVGLLVALDPGSLLVREDVPPQEALVFERTVLEPGVIRLEVTNEGASAVTIAQVLVDDAYWGFEMEPEGPVQPMRSTTLTLQYPWVEEEAHEVTLLTSTGATFHHEIPVAVTTPGVTLEALGVFTLIGLLVGVIPIFAGLLWYPAIQRAGDRFEAGLLAFTLGLLAFLVVESLAESLELAAEAPGPLGGPGLVLLGVAGAVAALLWVGSFTSKNAPAHSSRAGLVTAYLIAIGIGLHNLGEGLAIGAAYAVGEVALGAFLILGFTLHNVTEGPAIVSPISSSSPRLWHLAAMGAIAGGPTIVGAWIGGFAFSAFLGALFFALGAGAMLQVIFEVGDQMRTRFDLGAYEGVLAVGFLLGVAVMWGTGLLI